MFSKVLAAHSPPRKSRSLAQEHSMGQWLMVFDSLTDALHAGYMVHDRIEGGYLVRIMTAGGWAKAIVGCK
jgi:hypothetical protein